MKLTEEQAKIFISHIVKASGGKPIICPICGHNQWGVNNIVTEMREFQNGDFILGPGSAIMPFVSISCNNCAHTLFVNAIKAGIIHPQDKSDSEVSDGKKEE